MSLFAPRMWRCFSFRDALHQQCDVCSTHVEMFPVPATLGSVVAGLLHACGDVSISPTCQKTDTLFAPRMWRCFYRKAWAYDDEGVCSTHVEMFPARRSGRNSSSSLLHACGDVSRFKSPSERRNWFAPRMWRCFSSESWG